jgi:hypothetical protein
MKLNKMFFFLVLILAMSGIAFADPCDGLTLNQPFDEGGGPYSGTATISFTRDNCPENVKVYYARLSFTNKTSCSEITSWHPDSLIVTINSPESSYAWDTTKIPDRDDYCLRIEANEGLVYNTSKNTFTIDNEKPAISEDDIFVNMSECTGTAGTCKIGDIVKIEVDVKGDDSIDTITFTDEVGGVLYNLTNSVLDFFNDDGEGADALADDGIWTGSFEIKDSTTLPGAGVDTNGIEAYGIEIILEDKAGNKQTITSDTNKLSVDNIAPVLKQGTLISVTDNNKNNKNISAIGDIVKYIPCSFDGDDDGTTCSADLSPLTENPLHEEISILTNVTVQEGLLENFEPWGALETITDNAGNVVNGFSSKILVDNVKPIIKNGGDIIILEDYGVKGIAGIGDVIIYYGGEEETGDDVTWKIRFGMTLDYGGFQEEGVPLVLRSGKTDGNKDFNIEVIDDAGNVQTGKSNPVNIDDIPPVITSAGTITLTNDVNANGIAAIGDELTYAKGNGSGDIVLWTVNLSDYSLNPLQEEGTFTIIEDDDDGAFTAVETVTDKAGNTATGTVDLVGFTDIDNEKPNVKNTDVIVDVNKCTGNSGYCKIDDFIKVNVNLSDLTDSALNPVNFFETSGSDVGVITGFVDLGSDIWSSNITLKAGIVDDDIYEFKILVEDDAGNTVTLYSPPVRIDNEKPNITNGGNIIISKDGGVLDIAGINDGIDVDEITYLGGSDNTGDDITWTIRIDGNYGLKYGRGLNWIEANVPFPLQAGETDDRAKTFRVKATDKAGNTDFFNSNPVNIDDIPPSIVSGGIINLTYWVNNDDFVAINDKIIYTQGDVNVFDNDTWTVDLFELTGNSSAIPEVNYTVIEGNLDNSSWFAIETVTDKAGNTATEYTNFLNVDNEPPEFVSVYSNKEVYTIGDYLQIFAEMTQNDTELNLIANLSVLYEDFSEVQVLTNSLNNTFDHKTDYMMIKDKLKNDGVKSIIFTATDDAGNTANQNLEITLIKDKPFVSGISVTPNPTNSTTVTYVTATIDDDIAVIGAKYSIHYGNGTLITSKKVEHPLDGEWGGKSETLNINILSDIQGLPQGVYYINIYGEDANGYGDYGRQTFTISSSAAPGTGQTSNLRIISSSPKEVITYNNPVLEIETNENAQCKYSTSAFDFETEGTLMTGSGGKIHTYNLGILTDNTYMYYVICKDETGFATNPFPISFTIDTASNFDYVQNLNKGWNTLWLPNPLIIFGIKPAGWAYDPLWTLKEVYDKSGLEDHYEIVWYYDTETGEWLAFSNNDGNDDNNDLTTVNNKNDQPYWTKMKNSARFEAV